MSHSCQTEEELICDKDERKETYICMVDGKNSLYDEMEVK